MADTTFCDSNVPDYVARECGTDFAGIVGMVLIDVDEDPTEANLESESWYETEQDTSPQTIYVIRNTRGEYTSATPTEEEGFGLENTRVTGAEHTATVEVEGLAENRAFWEGVNRRRWKVGLVTAGGLMYYVNVAVSVYARVNNQRSTKGMAFWAIDLKWQSYSNPEIYDNVPLAVFAD